MTTAKNRRRRQMLEAARDVLLRFGFRKTTLDDIAREAGVSRATLYNYFANKDELVREIVEMEIEHLQETVRSAVDLEAPADEILRTAVEVRYAHLGKLRDLYRVVMNEARQILPVAEPSMAVFQRTQIEGFTLVLQLGIDQGRFNPVDADLFARTLLSGLRGIDEAYMFDDEDSVPAGASLLLDALLFGLVKESAR